MPNVIRKIVGVITLSVFNLFIGCSNPIEPTTIPESTNIYSKNLSLLFLFFVKMFVLPYYLSSLLAFCISFLINKKSSTSCAGVSCKLG